MTAPFRLPALTKPTDPQFNWSGAYLGLHFGLARGRSTATEINTIGDNGDPNYCLQNPDGTWTCNLNGQPHPIAFPISSFNMIGDTWGMKMNGSMAGVTAGYNFQTAGFVYGLEADVGYFNMSGRSAPSPYSQDDTFLHTAATDYATLRARFGYAIDRLLLFGTAGVAAAHFNSYVDDPDIAIGIKTEKTSLQWGYALGLGAEYALTDHITIKTDWLNMGFTGAKSIGYVNVTCAPGCPPQWKLNRAGMAGDGTGGWSISQKVDVVRVGANYKF